ncbi:MAG: hypothetical protein DWI02_09550 [Planctomycetota bacterium]|jgi:hypothetical protein|nr:MAG: hypothetical protein DWI02_09550 [Planctomycetota bacterium]
MSRIKAIWTHHYGWPYEGGELYPGPRSTPTWHEGHLYFSAPDGSVTCLKAVDGTRVWSCNPKKTHRGQGTDFGYAASPVIVEGRLILPVGGRNSSVVALDIRDGSTLWASGDTSASYATPLPIRWRDQSLVITPLENTLAAFDVHSGRQVWELDFSQGYDEHSAAPLYQEPFLFTASPFRAGAKCYRLSGEPDSSDSVASMASRSTRSNSQDHSRTSGVLDEQQDRTEGKATVRKWPTETASVVPNKDDNSSEPEQRHEPRLVWESAKFSNDIASSLLVDGRIYGFDLKDPQSRQDRPSRGEFRCLDFATGRVIWSTNRVGQANLIVADHKLILFTDSGELILARLGTDEYVELARTQVFRDEICWTYPALHRGAVFLRTQTRAAAIYLGAAPLVSTQPVKSVQNIPRGRAFDAQWLIGGEREFPATVPEGKEFLSWYLWSLAGIVLGTGIAIVSLNAGRLTPHASRTFFWITVVLCGGLGSPIINARQSDYILLWPLVLWAAFQLTLNVITSTEKSPDRKRRRWFSRGAGLLFIGVCLLYFHLCRGLGYAIEWSFLIGFLPAFAVAAVAAMFLTTPRRWWPVIDLACAAISFSAYFWFSVIFIQWKLVVGS